MANERDIREDFRCDTRIVEGQDIDTVLHWLTIHVANMNIETNIPTRLQQMNKHQILMWHYSERNSSQ